MFPFDGVIMNPMYLFPGIHTAAGCPVYHASKHAAAGYTGSQGVSSIIIEDTELSELQI